MKEKDLSKMPVSHETMAIHVSEVDRRFNAMEGRQDALEQKVDKIHAATDKIITLVESFEGGMRALELLARIIKPAAVVIAAIAGIVMWVKTGAKPFVLVGLTTIGTHLASAASKALKLLT